MIEHGQRVEHVGEEYLFVGRLGDAVAQGGACGRGGRQPANQAGQLPPGEFAGEQVAQTDTVLASQVRLEGLAMPPDQVPEA